MIRGWGIGRGCTHFYRLKLSILFWVPSHALGENQMYPLVEWGHQGIAERIHCLNSNYLFHESVIASAQVFEQVLKRILRNELAEGGLKIDKTKSEDGSNQFFLIPSASLAETDHSLHKHCQSVNTLQKMPWNLVMDAPKTRPILSELIIAITSQNEWECLIGRKKIVQPRWPDSIRKGAEDLPIDSIRCGLIAMRHQIVHGSNSPDPKTIKPLAFFGESFLTKVLCPSTGIASYGIRDPLKKCSRFRKEA